MLMPKQAKENKKKNKEDKNNTMNTFLLVHGRMKEK